MTILEPSTSALVQSNTRWYLRKGSRVSASPETYSSTADVQSLNGDCQAEAFVSRELKLSQEAMKKFASYTSHPAHFPWTYELWAVPDLYRLLTMTTRSSTLFYFERSPWFCQPASFIYYGVWPITTYLAITLHLYKEDWIKRSIYNRSLYKSCLSLFSPEHKLDCYLNLCPRLQPFPLLKKHFIP